MSGILNTTGAVSGILGTTVGTPTGGKFLQIITHHIANVSGITSAVNFPSSAVGFASAIQSDSDVWLVFNGYATTTGAGTSAYANILLTGGGISGDTAICSVINAMFYGENRANVRESWGWNQIDLAPGSTTPTYQCAVSPYGSLNIGFGDCKLTLLEIAA